MPALAAYPGKMACCLQLRLLRHPAPAPPPARVLLLLSPPRLRTVRASPGSPSANSFAGWSSDGADGDGGDQSPLGFGPAGGLLGPGLAAFFFFAGLTFAAVSIRSSSNYAAGTHPILLLFFLLTLSSNALCFFIPSPRTKATPSRSPSQLLSVGSLCRKNAKIVFR
jgi:hypothetical protein